MVLMRCATTTCLYPHWVEGEKVFCHHLSCRAWRRGLPNTADITHFNEGYGELLYWNLLLSGVPLIKPSSFRTFSKNLKYVNKILRNGISDHNEAKATNAADPSTTNAFFKIWWQETSFYECFSVSLIIVSGKHEGIIFGTVYSFGTTMVAHHHGFVCFIVDCY